MKRRGFTLIELLLVAVLAALLSLAILSVFSAGINVYSRLRSYSDIRTDILISLEKVEKDLRNASNISKIEFKGEPDRLTFPAVVSLSSGKTQSISPGSISYYVDNSTHYLVSEEKDYSAATATESEKGFVTQIAYINDIKFSYYSYDPKAKAYSWSDIWVKEADEDKATEKKIKVNTPLGVRVEMRYDNHGKLFVLKKMIFFPLAVSLRLSEMAKEKEKKNHKNEKKG